MGQQIQKVKALMIEVWLQRNEGVTGTSGVGIGCGLFL